MSRKKSVKKVHNLSGMILVSFVVCVLLLAISVNSSALKEKKAEYEKRDAYLSEKIQDEEARAEDITRYGQYTQTKQYVEDMAKEKLGLVYEDEIILVNEEP